MGKISTNLHENYIKEIIGTAALGDRIASRERKDLEFKQSFDMKNFSKYAKTLAAFSNTKGGYILFGIKDNPRMICGVNKAFDLFPQEKLTESLNALFSPELFWEAGTVDFADFSIGFLYVEECISKPVVALKSDNAARIQSGDIYYRYRARTEKIKYPEMNKIIQDRLREERERIMKLMEMIHKSDTANLGIVDYRSGRFSTPYGTDITIDKKIVVQVLRKAKFIKEGSFNETTGTPVLKVTGIIDLAEEIPVPDIEPEVRYPYIQKQLAEKLGISRQFLHALIWYYHMKGQKKYHTGFSTSSSGKINTHKFSDVALQFLADTINQHKDDKSWESKICEEYRSNKEDYPNGRES